MSGGSLYLRNSMLSMNTWTDSRTAKTSCLCDCSLWQAWLGKAWSFCLVIWQAINFLLVVLKSGSNCWKLHFRDQEEHQDNRSSLFWMVFWFELDGHCMCEEEKKDCGLFLTKRFKIWNNLIVSLGKRLNPNLLPVGLAAISSISVCEWETIVKRFGTLL